MEETTIDAHVVIPNQQFRGENVSGVNGWCTCLHKSISASLLVSGITECILCLFRKNTATKPHGLVLLDA